MATYYHITKPEHVADICNEGLRPSYGENSQSINDSRAPRISLCSQKSIDAWCILLGADRVIRVNLPKGFPVTLTDDTEGSDEYSTEQPIPAKYISKKYKHTPSQEVLDGLRENYMSCLSYFCTMCARYYTPGSEWKNDPDQRRKWYCLHEPKYYEENPDVETKAWFTQHGYDKYHAKMNDMLSIYKDNPDIEIRIVTAETLDNIVMLGKTQCIQRI